jgi:hypothetical protein
MKKQLLISLTSLLSFLPGCSDYYPFRVDEKHLIDGKRVHFHSQLHYHPIRQKVVTGSTLYIDGIEFQKSSDIMNNIKILPNNTLRVHRIETSPIFPYKLRGTGFRDYPDISKRIQFLKEQKEKPYNYLETYNNLKDN